MMPQFTFRLDAVLRQRELAERRAQAALAEAARKVAALEDDLRQLQASAEDAGQWMNDGRLQGPINLQLLAAHRRYLNSVASVGGEQVRRLALARRDADAARAALADAAKRRGALETLRDKQRDQWLSDRKRREAAADDEAATQMTFANRRA